MTQTATCNGTSTTPWIPYEIVDGHPVNPVEPNLPPTCADDADLGEGEIRAIDAFVTCITPDGQRWLLLIERRDGRGWALVGGKLKAGEPVLDGTVRELDEETTLTLPGIPWWLSPARYVYDSRNRRNRWFVTVIAHAEIGLVLWPPFVEGADDARRATWARANSPLQVADDLADRYNGRLFDAHETMLDEFLA
jgi:ADP-ribose pyrophosphatase